jgi:hypothetical protein
VLGYFLQEIRRRAVRAARIGDVNPEGRPGTGVAHDRIHAKKPTHDLDRWETGVIEDVFERDSHCLVVVDDEGEAVELRVTLAIRDLFVRRLDLAEGDSPVGSRVWYRKRGRN